MQKGTRIQTHDTSFINQLTQRCTGHDHGHSPVEGGQVVRDTAFYPKRFCQRVVQIWKDDVAKTPKRILQKFEEARLAEETLYICSGCNSRNPAQFPICPTCDADTFNEVMRGVRELTMTFPTRASPNRLLVQKLRSQSPEKRR